MRKAAILGLPVVLLGIGALMAPLLPDQMVVLWNGAGEAQTAVSRLWGIVTLPAVTFLTAVALLRLAHLRRARFDGQSRALFEGSLVYLQGMLGAVYLVLLGHNAGLPISPLVLGPLIGGLALVGAGMLVARAERNPLLGVRTRHTLADPVVWSETNARAALWLRLAGGVAMLGLLAPQYAVYLVAGPAVLVALAAQVFAARLYRARHSDKR